MQARLLATGDVGRFVGPSYPNQPTIDSTGDTIGGLWNSGTAAVTISPNGAGVLTLTATNVGGQAATGILLDANAGGMTIGAPILLAGNQSWTTSSAFNALTITNSISLGGNTLTPAVSMSGAMTISGDISGAGSLTKTSTTNIGILVLSGSNSFTGTTVTTAGAIEITNSAALQQSLVMGGSYALTVNGGGKTVVGSEGSIDFTTLTSAQFGNIGGSASTAFNLVNDLGQPVALTVGNSTSSTFAGVLTGSAGTLNEIGSGVLLLAGSNWGGNTLMATQGTLALGNATAGLFSTLTVNGGKVQFIPSTPDVYALGALNGNGNLCLADTSAPA